jgi:hypothetical protein
MGASVNGYWKDITEEQRDSMPGFANDDRAFGNWMASRAEEPRVLQALKALDCGALLSITTDGVPAEDIEWVTPDELRAAATTLRGLVLRQDARTAGIVESYSKSANGIDPVHEEFARDLGDVAQIADFAASEGIRKMTLEVNW